MLWRNTMTKGTWGGKTLFGLHFNIRLHHPRHSRQELKHGRNLEAGADVEATEGYCLLACLLSRVNSVCFLREPRAICPEAAPSIIFWLLPHQLRLKKMLHRVALSPALLRHFLNWSFLLSDGSGLCQVDIKLFRTSSLLHRWRNSETESLMIIQKSRREGLKRTLGEDFNSVLSTGISNCSSRESFILYWTLWIPVLTSPHTHTYKYT